ncbi:MAG: AAA family ATPase [Lewinellaceae bacterium]|nr:AAA family ATPase [Lewinellaceae bacterium]
MNKEALARLFYRELEKIAGNEVMDEVAKVEALYRLLTLLFVEMTRRERLQFSTLFARMAYICHRAELSRALQFYIHSFRKLALLAQQGKGQEPGTVYQLGLKVVAEAVAALMEQPVPEAIVSMAPKEWPVRFRSLSVREFRPRARVLALSDDEGSQQLIVRDEEYPDQSIRVQYNEVDRNENFMPTIEVARKVFGFPLMLNLIDVEVDDGGVFHPRAFVVEPDYLMDVTAVAECFRADGENPWPYLLNKFLPFETNKYIMAGHIANFFLDELMTGSELSFKETFAKAFQLNPLAFCLFDDRMIREIMNRSQKHFVVLNQMVKQGFKDQGIEPGHCYLEPSFYSETYGLQGRLDVLYKGEKDAAIVELKSGSPFMPNIYGLSANHFTQTLLYDLIVRSAFGNDTDPTNYILYSSQDEKPLRFAPRIRSQQYEALQVRNQLVAIERLLGELGNPEKGGMLEQGLRLFGRLRPGAFPNLKGFLQRDLELFEKVFGGMNELSQRYFIAFAGFIAREHQLAKTGQQGVENINGLASLWLDDFSEKQESFNIISHLKLAANQAGEEEPLVSFRRTEWTNPLANFRTGDIAVLYPHQDGRPAALYSQIFKCTIIEITNETVTVRLRSRQFNSAIFEQYQFWNLEHDLLDSSFVSMYRGLFAFAQSPKDKQELLLATRPPREGEAREVATPLELTPEQQDIFQKALSAEDYFLLWGPPGTGKTSMMLKYLVAYLLDNTEENLLLLAYTNRAVDEICEAIESIRQDIRRHYLRIGSRYSTDPRFRSQLLGSKIEKAQTRQEIKDVIGNHRIFVGTVASIVSKPELLQLKHFHRVIIDEASQILEPLLVGLLPHFERFILIGDHKQLPAVVVQDSEASAVYDPQLQEVGLGNLRNSLFERLYKRCIQYGWDWAYAQLSHQGRMHQDIMEFPNRYFYDGTLKILPPSLPAHLKQVAQASYSGPIVQDELLQRLTRDRVAFLPTPTDDSSATQKTNSHEAHMIGEVVDAFHRLFHINGMKMAPHSIGIITPYRAQIAQIRAVLEERGAPLDMLTIDTVERYQGGARDIILISLCTNSLHQLASLSSFSEEGVDRKLNVALTRAREHIVIIGNPELLRQSEIYRELLQFCEEKTVEP